jgi:hypothetical protein
MASNIPTYMCTQCFAQFYNAEQSQEHWRQNHAPINYFKTGQKIPEPVSRIVSPEVLATFAKDRAKAEAEARRRDAEHVKEMEQYQRAEDERRAEAELNAWRKQHIG